MRIGFLVIVPYLLFCGWTIFDGIELEDPSLLQQLQAVQAPSTSSPAPAGETGEHSSTPSSLDISIEFPFTIGSGFLHDLHLEEFSTEEPGLFDGVHTTTDPGLVVDRTTESPVTRADLFDGITLGDFSISSIVDDITTESPVTRTGLFNGITLGDFSTSSIVDDITTESPVTGTGLFNGITLGDFSTSSLVDDITTESPVTRAGLFDGITLGDFSTSSPVDDMTTESPVTRAGLFDGITLADFSTSTPTLLSETQSDSTVFLKRGGQHDKPESDHSYFGHLTALLVISGFLLSVGLLQLLMLKRIALQVSLAGRAADLEQGYRIGAGAESVKYDGEAVLGL